MDSPSVAFRHEGENMLQMIWAARQMADVDDPPMTPMTSWRFYTDGSCTHPSISEARRASYAVIQDTNRDDAQRRQALDGPRDELNMPGGLVCADFGLVHGDQTIGRAEILAIWSGLRMVMRTGSDLPINIYTDSQYAITMCRLLQRFKHTGVTQLSISIENYDILQKMLQRWPPNAITFLKVKSHRPESSAADSEDLWNILGNAAADHLAAHALTRELDTVRHLSEQIASHMKMEQARLGAVLHFTTHMSIARLRALEERDEEDFRRHQHLQDNPPEDARVLCPIPKATRSRQHLQQWAPVCKPPRIMTHLDIREARSCNMGTYLADLTWKWMHTLEWPDPDHPVQEPDWGVNVLELLFNFYLLTGQRMLVNHECVPKVNKFTFVRWNSIEANARSDSLKSAEAQADKLRQTILQLQALHGFEVFPTQYVDDNISLRVLGFPRRCRGFRCRPKMMHSARTVQLTFEYLQQNRFPEHLRQMAIMPSSPGDAFEITSAADPDDFLGPVARTSLLNRIRAARRHAA